MTYSKVQGVRNEIAEAHNALRSAVIYFVVTVIALVVEVYLAIQNGAWQMVAVAGVGTGLMIAAGWSVRLIRQGRHRFGIRLLIGASLLSVLTAPFFIVGFGLMLGLGTMLIVLTVASQTLPAKETNLWLVGSVLIAIVAGGIDLSVDYFLFTALDLNSRLNEPIFQTMIAALGGSMIAIYTVFIARQYHTYPLLTKLLVTFLFVSLVPLGILALINIYNTRAALTADANETLFAAAVETAAAIDNLINNSKTSVETEAQLLAFVNYLQLAPEDRPGTHTEEEVVSILQAFSRRDRLFIDSYALLDMTGRNVRDTVQADIGQDESAHEYFQKPMMTGLTYVSPVQILPDHNQEAFFFVSAPIRLEPRGKIVGVLRVRYKAAILQQLIVRNNELVGQGSFAILLDEHYIRLAHGNDPRLIFKTIASPDEAEIAAWQSALRMPNQAPADLSTNLPDFERGVAQGLIDPFFTTYLPTNDQVNAAAVAHLESQPWVVVFVQPREVFLAPVRNQTRTSLFLAITIAGVVMIIAFWMAQILSAPLLDLTAVVTRFTTGDLTARSTVKGDDETGLLADSFNVMAEQMGNLFNNLEEYTDELEQHREHLEEKVALRTEELTAANTQLQQEINERNRIELKLRQRNEYLRALHETTLGLITRLELNDLLEAIIIRAGQLLGTEHGYIYLLREDETRLELMVGTGIFSRYLGELVELGEGVAGKVWQNRRPLTIENYDNWSGRDPDFAYKLIKTSTASPLMSGDKVTGVIGTAYPFDSEKSFNLDELELLNRFAELASIALDNAQLYMAAQQEISEHKETQAKLEKAKIAAEMSNQAKSAFLANITHELRTPLNAIIGYSEIIEEEADDFGYTDLVPDIKKIWTAGDHLLTLINELLDLSKIEAGKMALYLEMVPVENLVNDVVNTIKPLVDKNGNTLTVNCPNPVGAILTDPIRLRQMLLNLLSNAAKFTQDGAIIMNITRHSENDLALDFLVDVPPNGQDQIDPDEAEPLTGHIVFEVADTGIGMTAEQMRYVFEPFTQADASTTQRYGGTGLGLAISYGFCKMMGGDITVSSQVNRGSTFRLTLPLAVKNPQHHFEF